MFFPLLACHFGHISALTWHCVMSCRALKRQSPHVPWTLRQLVMRRVRREVPRARDNTYGRRPRAATAPTNSLSRPANQLTASQRITRESRPLPPLPATEETPEDIEQGLGTRRMSAPSFVPPRQPTRGPGSRVGGDLSPSWEHRPLPPLPSIHEPGASSGPTGDPHVSPVRPRRPPPEPPVSEPSQTVQDEYTPVRKQKKPEPDGATGTSERTLSDDSSGATGITPEVPERNTPADIVYDRPKSNDILYDDTLALTRPDNPVEAGDTVQAVQRNLSSTVAW